MANETLPDEALRAIKGLNADELATPIPELDDIGDELVENEDGSVTLTEAEEGTRELAQLLQMPVTTSVDGKSAFPEDHPLALGTSGLVLTGHGRHFLAKSDLILAVGTSLTRHNLVNPIFSYSKKFVHVTNDTRDLYKGYETDVAILGDAKLVLTDQLIEAARAAVARPCRKRIPRSRKATAAGSSNTRAT